MILENIIFDKVLILPAILLLGLLLRYHWRRRHLYIAAAKINGPFGWPIVGSGLSFTGNTHELLNTITRKLEEYKSPGKMWLGPRLYFGISRPEQLEIILNSPQALEKDFVYDFISPAAGNGLLTAPVPVWKVHRKIISSTFNSKTLNFYIPIFQEQSIILVKNLEKYDGRGMFDVFEAVHLCTLDGLWETAIGVNINAQLGNSKIAKWIADTLEVMFLRLTKIWLYPDLIFHSTKYGKIQTECIENGNKITLPVIEKKRAEYRKNHKNKLIPEEQEEILMPKRKIFLDHLIHVSEETGSLTNKDILDEVFTLVVAGSDSTAAACSFACIMLGMHPEIQGRVYGEIQDIFQNENRTVRTDDVSKMKYLEKVIKETMRLFPTAPLIARAITEDIQLDGYLLPKGSSCVLAAMKVQRDAEFWPDPLTFNPDRFDPDQLAKIHPYAYLPFSAGPRNCVGLKYAMIQMKVIMSDVIRNYEISTDYKSVADIRLEQDIVIRASDGFRVALKKRNSN